jgi:hypothetical protein
MKKELIEKYLTDKKKGDWSKKPKGGFVESVNEKSNDDWVLVDTEKRKVLKRGKGKPKFTSSRNQEIMRVSYAKKKGIKIDESSPYGSTELWFGSWSRPLLIYLDENIVLWSYNHEFPPGYEMTQEDRDRARARGYIILDV